MEGGKGCTLKVLKCKFAKVSKLIKVLCQLFLIRHATPWPWGSFCLHPISYQFLALPTPHSYLSLLTNHPPPLTHFLSSLHPSSHYFFPCASYTPHLLSTSLTSFLSSSSPPLLLTSSFSSPPPPPHLSHALILHSSLSLPIPLQVGLTYPQTLVGAALCAVDKCCLLKLFSANTWDEVSPAKKKRKRT